MSIDCVVKGIIHCAKNSGVNRKNGSGITPLHRMMRLTIVYDRCAECKDGILVLLELGADPRIIDNHGAKPVDQYKWVDEVKIALEYYENTLDTRESDLLR